MPAVTVESIRKDANAKYLILSNFALVWNLQRNILYGYWPLILSKAKSVVGSSANELLL